MPGQIEGSSPFFYRRYLTAGAALAIALAGFPLLAAVADETSLSSMEREEIETRLERFYADPGDAAAMQSVPPKFSPESGRFVHGNPGLRRPEGMPEPSDPLLAAAQEKASAEFQRRYCEEVLRSKFPELNCEAGAEGRAAVEANDRIEKLVTTWIPTDRLVLSMEGLPDKGETALPIWSDDYWRTRFGQTSYRYASGTYFSAYKTAVAAYAQPAEWTPLAKTLDPVALAKRLVGWSPAEKYDLSLGDEAFTLTNAQKREGERYLNSKNDVENWMGLCHGWAAAAVMAPPPKKPVTLVGPKAKGGKSASVEWYPGDIKALLTLAWGNGNTYNNFIGGRCNVSKPATYPNGRIRQQECFDNNPTTFHLALANLIGLAQHSFVMDTTFDYEVWNQPLRSYQVTYFNPLDRTKRSVDWREVAVPYDAKFKAADRFQKPLTRGVRTNAGYDDAGIKKIVGVIATVAYVVELTPPPHQPEPPKDAVERVTYLYDLELHEKDGKTYPKGGEWHENVHPDFLWIPKAETVARTAFDFVDLAFSGTKAPPSAEATETAKAASVYSYPLCQPLRKLLAEATGEDSYKCPEPRP